MALLPFGVIAQTPPPSPKPNPGPPPSFLAKPAAAPEPKMPDMNKLSYAVGVYFGNTISNRIAHITLDHEVMFEGVRDTVEGKPRRMTDQEVRETLNQFSAAMNAKRKEEAEQAKAKGEAFLAEYAKRPGVTTLPDGVEYSVLKAGTGPKPTGNDMAVVGYRGTLTDGTEFDRGDSFSASLRGGVIPGWETVLPLMSVGSKWQVVIPSALAYGQRGRPPKIPPDSVLVFDIELKSIKAGAPTLPPLSTKPPGAFNPPPPRPSAPPTNVVSGEIIKVPSADDLKKGAQIEVIKNGQTNAVNSQ